MDQTDKSAIILTIKAINRNGPWHSQNSEKERLGPGTSMSPQMLDFIFES